ncbi:hypothetical protein PRIPAC_82073 [Pristionchus pacificus]|uniref:Uncharacterized protein n=1 Tax=Pristionchus pacificus TaxID=54126 RepID=A0A2A6CPI4_PRIPA|nr:hypothetical protein PRIPAC_82073 [Pristionchus pacificus]|eukprot:PDM80049.1 hypothetical protein PRIPAC_32628 [Pristionchus pacificus]
MRSVYEQTCQAVSSPSSTVRGERCKRGIDWVETAGVAAIGIVSTIFYPVGAGIGAALGTMNAMKIADLDYKMRTKIYIDHCCVGDVMVAHVVHSDPFNTIRGSLYMVADPGNFLINEKLYVYHDIPKELFLSDDDETLPIEKCLPTFGNTSICTKRTEFVSDSACSVYNYESNCPRIVVNMDQKGSYVRKIGENLIIVSTRANRKRKAILKRRMKTAKKDKKYVQTEESVPQH